MLFKKDFERSQFQALKKHLRFADLSQQLKTFRGQSWMVGDIRFNVWGRWVCGVENEEPQARGVERKE